MSRRVPYIFFFSRPALTFNWLYLLNISKNVKRNGVFFMSGNLLLIQMCTICRQWSFNDISTDWLEGLLYFWLHVSYLKSKISYITKPSEMNLQHLNTACCTVIYLHLIMLYFANHSISFLIFLLLLENVLMIS